MSGDLSTAGSSRNYAAYGYVECGPCVGKKQKAVKSCLTCLDSYCPAHLDLHEELHAGKRHKLINATGFLEDKICSRHEKLLEVFCCSDQQCICLMCTMDNHLGHTIVSAAAERTEKQSQLGEPKKKSLQRILEREKELAELQRAVDTHKRCAQAALQESEKIFDEMIRSIEQRRSEVQDLIKAQEKVAVSRAEVFLKQLEEEIAELRKRDEELQHLSLVEDHIHFLQRFVVLSAPPGTSDLPTITVSSAHTFDDVAKSVIQLKKCVDDFCKEDMEKITTKVKQIQILTPMTREEVLQYFCDLTLDYNTAYRRLALYDGNKSVVNNDRDLTYPDHPDRFDWPQVLCKETVCGRAYWEVEWGGTNGVNIAVSYRSIRRKGGRNECWFGCSEQSWRLYCSPFRYAFRHHSKETYIPKTNHSTRIGVYVDYDAGTLSFYSIGDKMILLYKVQTEFTEPLYAGFTVWPGSKLTLCPPAKL
ncbi:tripartite motif-containing protein 16-like [Colossoma macropomum]|uniref:tripartite motif-containing protein 16-like n=1 Tax=Colossoma macropomum TaxID=42526 RepID=UPI0018651F4A|nr:tripartite motif-containing protein 16-like [Colossoma macropomum]XP_036412474.1 tripartite motif-containing protein 16-like [Colossoma macropomum]